MEDTKLMKNIKLILYKLNNKDYFFLNNLLFIFNLVGGYLNNLKVWNKVILYGIIHSIDLGDSSKYSNEI